MKLLQVYSRGAVVRAVLARNAGPREARRSHSPFGTAMMAGLATAISTATMASPTPTIPRACAPPHDTYDFCDPKLPLQARIDDLLSLLTLEEKPTLLIARNSPRGNVSRLGVPEYDWGGNCIHGVQSRCADDGRCPTSFPNPNSLGASFNRSVWRSMGEVIGVELRSLWLQGVGENHASDLPHIGLDCWSPNIGIVRDPRWGRNLETPSEDPTLCGGFGVEVTKGLQESKSDHRFVQAVVSASTSTPGLGLPQPQLPTPTSTPTSASAPT